MAQLLQLLKEEELKGFSYPSQNFVVAVSAEGWFHLFDLTSLNSKHPDASGHHELAGAEEQKPVFKQHIPANTKVMLINDIGEPQSWGGNAGQRGLYVRQWGEKVEGTWRRKLLSC